jgi:hypothetical protein
MSPGIDTNQLPTKQDPANYYDVVTNYPGFMWRFLAHHMAASVAELGSGLEDSIRIAHGPTLLSGRTIHTCAGKGRENLSTF